MRAARQRPRPVLNPGAASECAAELADLFKLLGDATRLRIVLSCIEMPIAVSEIADRLDLSVSLVSHHLRLLKAARIVRAQRQGKQVFYTAADDHIRSVVGDMLEHITEPESTEE